MARKTKIAWCDATFNPWTGCVKVSEGCDHCYAERWARRRPELFGQWGSRAIRVIASDRTWEEPRRWNRAAERKGKRRRVFCGSMCDVFEGLGGLLSVRQLLFRLIRDTPHLDWLLLTKRAHNLRPLLWYALDGGLECEPHILEVERLSDLLPNLALGVTAENQDAFDRRASYLLRVPVALRFISCEPLLGPINLGDLEGIGWVIVGGETGPGARPMDLAWARSIRDQCQAAGVPFFFKQTGPKKCELLDGREWKEFPAPIGANNYERIET